MPVDYTIDAERQLVYSRAWGEVTDAELLDHQGRLALDPRFNADFSQLLDFVGVTSHGGLTASGIRAIAQRHLYGPHSRRAIATPDATGYGLARMFETYRDIAGGEEQIRVFTSLDDAWKWLGMAPPELKSQP